MGAHAAAAIGRSRALRGALAASPSIDPSAADSGTGQAGGGPEIDCVSTLLASNVIDDAERRAAALGIGADRVLITAGQLSEEAYLRALMAALGVIFEPLDDTPRAFCPLNDERLIESTAAGMLPLVIKDELYLVVRGGARVIYLFGGDDVPVFLLAAFAKNETADLTAAERTALSKQVTKMLSDYRRHRRVSAHSRRSKQGSMARVPIGGQARYRMHVLETVDVKKIRIRLGLSQQAFAATYRFALSCGARLGARASPS